MMLLKLLSLLLLLKLLLLLELALAIALGYQRDDCFENPPGVRSMMDKNSFGVFGRQ